jgi:competence ComEA-like helix-hairpin-helix protein
LNASRRSNERHIAQDQADAVVHYQEQNGDFKNMQHLQSVPGIDPAKLKNQQSRITF